MSRALMFAFAIGIIAVLGLGALFVAGSLPLMFGAGTGKQLQREAGTVGYATTASAADFKPVFAKFELPDEDWAITQGDSAAVLAMPDSALLTLGANTQVRAGAFSNAAPAPGSVITLNGGALRFDIRRPPGGLANYRFVTTTTSAVVVHGAVGEISFHDGVTKVDCVTCAADSVTVTAGSRTIALTTGHAAIVSAGGTMTTSEKAHAP